MTQIHAVCDPQIRRSGRAVRSGTLARVEVRQGAGWGRLTGNTTTGLGEKRGKPLGLPWLGGIRWLGPCGALRWVHQATIFLASRYIRVSRQRGKAAGRLVGLRGRLATTFLASRNMRVPFQRGKAGALPHFPGFAKHACSLLFYSCSVRLRKLLRRKGWVPGRRSPRSSRSWRRPVRTSGWAMPLRPER